MARRLTRRSAKSLARAPRRFSLIFADSQAHGLELRLNTRDSEPFIHRSGARRRGNSEAQACARARALRVCVLRIRTPQQRRRDARDEVAGQARQTRAGRREGQHEQTPAVIGELASRPL